MPVSVLNRGRFNTIPQTWAVAASSASHDTVRSWYAANTGHEALGVAATDLVPGSLDSTHDGQVIEGVVASRIRIQHNNVTIRGCRVQPTTISSIDHCHFNPRTSGATFTGSVVEYTTFDTQLVYDEVGEEAQAGILLPQYGLQNSVTIQHCNIKNFTTGFRCGSGVTFRYNWMHDFQHPPEGHANMARAAGQYVHIYRNYLTDGRSACCSIYFHQNTVSDARIEENIIDAVSPLANPNYLIQCTEGAGSAGTQNIKWLNNLMGNSYQSGEFAGGTDVAWGTDGNERTGNRNFFTGALSSWND